MGDDQFEKMLQMATKEANKEYEILYVTTQSKDHPIDINMSETKYLKFYCLIIK